jgi:hypothetical protein
MNLKKKISGLPLSPMPIYIKENVSSKNILNVLLGGVTGGIGSKIADKISPR